MQTTHTTDTSIKDAIKRLPRVPGVYVFKDEHDHVIYIGKAKDLRARGMSYTQNQRRDWKAATILKTAASLEHHPTKSELEALLLEARLVQNHQPPFNVLLKTGQPFVYLMLTPGTKKKLPDLIIARNKKKKGTYFGPFIEKSPARKVHAFLQRTFKLKRCSRTIENGCLYYHLGQCAGSCRPDFDRADYERRLDLAIMSLKKGRRAFLTPLNLKIASRTLLLDFEGARELVGYRDDFSRVFPSLNAGGLDAGGRKALAEKDVWVFSPHGKTLYVFRERDGVLKKQHAFYAIDCLTAEQEITGIDEYFLSYYRTYPAPATILVDAALSDKRLYEEFLYEWNEKKHRVDIVTPRSGHFAAVVRLARAQAEHMTNRQIGSAQAIKRLLGLPVAPRTIDCFDISHKQGTNQVGSCVRFVDGQPDKNSFRRFHIKTVDQQNDYACLREIVGRRYRDGKDLPDMILIDGGKGQLNAVSDLFDGVVWASLAKKEETVFTPSLPDGKVLDLNTYAGQVLVALRDYTHHFAISFHRKLAAGVGG